MAFAATTWYFLIDPAGNVEKAFYHDVEPILRSADGNPMVQAVAGVTLLVERRKPRAILSTSVASPGAMGTSTEPPVLPEDVWQRIAEALTSLTHGDPEQARTLSSFLTKQQGPMPALIEERLGKTARRGWIHREFVRKAERGELGQPAWDLWRSAAREASWKPRER